MFDISHEVGKNAGKDDEWGMQTFAKDITLKRLSEPEDVAAAASFLAGPDSNYITSLQWFYPLQKLQSLNKRESERPSFFA